MLILFGSINKCVQVSITWFEDRPYSYRALYKLWEVLNSSPSHTYGPDGHIGSTEGHTYGPDGHIRLAKHMIRKICTKIYSEYIYATNSYP
jgi:hypothetical protein